MPMGTRIRIEPAYRASRRKPIRHGFVDQAARFEQNQFARLRPAPFQKCCMRYKSGVRTKSYHARAVSLSQGRQPSEVDVSLRGHICGVSGLRVSVPTQINSKRRGAAVTSCPNR